MGQVCIPSYMLAQLTTRNLTVAYLRVDWRMHIFLSDYKACFRFQRVHGSCQTEHLFLRYLCSCSELLRTLSESCNSSGCHFHLISCVAGGAQQNCVHFGQHLLPELKGKGAFSS